MSMTPYYATTMTGLRGAAKVAKWGIRKYRARKRRARAQTRAYKKGRNRARVARRFRTGGRVKRTNKKGLTSHSDLKRSYNHDSLSICVGQSTKMLNTTKLLAIDEEEIVDHISDYATQTITNNGINPEEMITGTFYENATTDRGAVYFGNDDLTTYNQVDYLKQVGLYKYTLTTPQPYSSPSPNDVIHITSNQIFNLRSMFKKWRKDQISFQIKWRGMINATQPLGTPKGYYRLITASKERVSYKADGTEYTQGEDPKLITHYENQFFSPEQTLARKYGSYTDSINLATGTSRGAFFNGTDGLTLADMYRTTSGHDWIPKVGQQTFCYRNIRENPKGWKRIPSGKTLLIQHSYVKQFHPTQENDIALDPILLFVFENTDMWQPTQQDITLIDAVAPATGYTGNAVPHQDKEIMTAIIADIEVLHTFKFSGRATLNKPAIIIPDPSGYHPY